MKRDTPSDAADSGGAPPAASLTRTTCPYCGVGCGVIARTAADGSVSVAGDPAHPANFGRLCAKGTALAETLGLDDRLLHPQIAGQRATWDEALDLVAERFRSAVAEHGPDSVAFYVSGQLLTEDYYLANKLMKGFIGSANIDTNSRLCMASAVAGHRRAFGTDTVPGTYEDMEIADLVVLVGSNLAWCHPVLHQRLMAAKAERPELTVVAIDPRRTATADAADIHLAIQPGSDVALFSGLLAYLDEIGAVDRVFVDDHTEGFVDALAAARAVGVAGASTATGLGETEIRGFYELFTRNDRVVTVFSQGINQASNGTDRVNAIINCHLATGRVGRPGASPFSITGQPNAMGGREVGGLANQLAAHGELDDAEDRARVQAFWGVKSLPRRPGLKAVDLFAAMRDGRIKALLVMATNPADSLPDADGVVEALKACPFVVVADVTAETDTAVHADVLLPASAWGEKNGTVTNSERRISRQRAFLPPPGEARPDGWILAEIGRRMGFPGFDHAGPAAVFREHAALSRHVNAGRRDFDLGGLAGISDGAYEALDPVQWPVRDNGSPAGGRLLGRGQSHRASGRFRFVTPAPAADCGQAGRFVLNTGRIRDQWHTMTRTAKTARLMGHIAEPFCQIHPADARSLGIEPASLVTVSSPFGSVVVRAQVSDQVFPGSVFVPMHWTDRLSSRGRIDSVVAPKVDPISGQPALKGGRCDVARFPASRFGFAVTAHRPITVGLDYFALARARSGHRLEFALLGAEEHAEALARRILGLSAAEALIAVADEATGSHRFAAVSHGRLLGAVWMGPEPVAVSRAFAAEQLGTAASDLDLASLLAGRPGSGSADGGAVVCSCFNVGVKTIEAAVRSGACGSVEEVGRALQAGSNCGSCRPEIKRIVQNSSRLQPA